MHNLNCESHIRKGTVVQNCADMHQSIRHGTVVHNFEDFDQSIQVDVYQLIISQLKSLTKCTLPVGSMPKLSCCHFCFAETFIPINQVCTCVLCVCVCVCVRIYVTLRATSPCTQIRGLLLQCPDCNRKRKWCDVCNVWVFRSRWHQHGHCTLHM